MRPLRILSLMLLMFVAAAANAAGDKSVKGEFTYFGDKNDSREQCRRHALEGARLQALAKEFGTVLTQDTYQHDRLSGREESTYFSQLTSTAVKGEWLADEGEPQFEYSLDSEGCYVVTCIVRGRAREISNEATDFTASVLRNSTDPRNASTDFHDGDDMYLYMRTPVDGYVAVFLAGEDNNVYSLLPYQQAPGPDMKLRRNTDYVFFDSASGRPEHGTVDELQLSTFSNIERNSLYVVFSPNAFSRIADNFAGENIPRSTSIDDFSAWLARARRNDPKMGVRIMNITIQK
ncbi:MAG: DUF4384 domain-containing protein [Muribaculaceae bacterium]|nr:DUF4384 domain-containing protein [Muribaculaceae bacterium]